MTTITAILGFLWALFKTLAFWSCIIFLIGCLFGLFHPIRMDLKWRASPNAQRGEIWFSYFFGLLGFGTLASVGEQWLLLRVWNKKWKIYSLGERERRSRPPQKPKPPKDKGQPPAQPPGGPFDAPIDKVYTFEEKTDAEVAGFSLGTDLPREEDQTPSPSSDASMPDEKPFPPVEKKESPDRAMAAEIAPPAEPPPEVSTEPLKMAEPETKAGTPPPIEPPKEPPIPPSGGMGEPEKESFWRKIQNLRKKANKAMKKVRWVYRQARKIWNRFSPVLKNLLRDLWSSFEIRGPNARFRYGFEEPHLVGMFQGAIVQIAGFLWPWGVKLDFVPVFVSNTLLVRGDIGVVVFPWKVVFGTFRLGLEPEIWRGIKDFWTWYRTRKNEEKPS